MINQLISHLIAIKEFSKDIHYTCHSQAFYGKHLLADRVQEEIEGFIDELKETALLGADERPLQSKEYLQRAVILIPDVLLKDDKQNFIELHNLIVKTLDLIQGVEDNRGTNALFDDIARDLQQSKGLINLQIED